MTIANFTFEYTRPCVFVERLFFSTGVANMTVTFVYWIWFRIWDQNGEEHGSCERTQKPSIFSLCSQVKSNVKKKHLAITLFLTSEAMSFEVGAITRYRYKMTLSKVCHPSTLKHSRKKLGPLMRRSLIPTPKRRLICRPPSEGI